MLSSEAAEGSKDSPSNVLKKATFTVFILYLQTRMILFSLVSVLFKRGRLKDFSNLLGRGKYFIYPTVYMKTEYKYCT